MFALVLAAVLLTLALSWFAADFLFERRHVRRARKMKESRIELPKTFPVD